MAAKYAGNFNIDNVTDEETNDATISRNKEDSKKSKNSINQNSNQSEQKNRLKKFERKESYKDRSEVKNDLFTSPEKLEDISRKGKIPSFDIDDFKFIKSIGEGSFGKIYLIENINSANKNINKYQSNRLNIIIVNCFFSDKIKSNILIYFNDELCSDLSLRFIIENHAVIHTDYLNRSSKRK